MNVETTNNVLHLRTKKVRDPEKAKPIKRQVETKNPTHARPWGMYSDSPITRARIMLSFLQLTSKVWHRLPEAHLRQRVKGRSY